MQVKATRLVLYDVVAHVRLSYLRHLLSEYSVESEPGTYCALGPGTIVIQSQPTDWTFSENSTTVLVCPANLRSTIFWGYGAGTGRRTDLSTV